MQNEKLTLSEIIEEIRKNSSDEFADKVESAVKSVMQELTVLLVESKCENENLRKKAEMLESKVAVLERTLDKM